MHTWIREEIRQEYEVLFKGTESLESDESLEQTFEKKWHLMQSRDSGVGVNIGFHIDKYSCS